MRRGLRRRINETLRPVGDSGKSWRAKESDDMLQARGVSTRLVILLMVAASLAACGRRGDPVAPVAATAPAETVETTTPPTP